MLVFGRGLSSIILSDKLCHPQYMADDVKCDALMESISDACSLLTLPYTENTITEWQNGVYVHLYKNSIKCSDLTLEQAAGFFRFVAGGENSLPGTTETVDVQPFMYSNGEVATPESRDMRLKENVETTGKYTWAIDPLLPWSWTEREWNTHLFHCITESSAFQGVKVTPAYLWDTGSYQQQIHSIFPRVLSLKASPFRGMTDILLTKTRVALINIDGGLCCIEVGIGKGRTHAVHVGAAVKVWPQKLGELLASMFMFGTLRYLNNLSSPNTLTMGGFTTYGILAIHKIGCIVLRLDVDERGSWVHVVHEGTPKSMGKVLAQVATWLNSD